MKIDQTVLKKGMKLTQVTFQDGSFMEFLNVGASLTRWKDSSGKNIVAGYQNYEDYLEDGMFLGATVGLTAGRIAKGTCQIEGTTYHFESKNPNFLHGGDHGLSFFLFELESVISKEESAVLTYKIDYVHDFLPGMTSVKVQYTVSPGYLKIDFYATASKSILCNLTNHSYFNLDGDFSSDLSTHQMQIQADHVVEVDEEILGTHLISVEGTVFDFRKPKMIMPVVRSTLLQNQKALGLDHYFVFKSGLRGPGLTLMSLKSGLRLNIHSSYPGVTVYSTNYPTKKLLQNGVPAIQFSAVAIEPQFQSNGINDSRFFNLILPANQPYHHFIEYQLESLKYHCLLRRSL
jgi:aldose 1-epimerase